MTNGATIFFAAVRSLVYMTCFLFLWGWLSFSARAYDTAFGISIPSWTEIFGIICMASGGILAIMCVSIFTVTGRGTPAPFDPPRQFVARGPYKWVRNPMYIGGFFMLFGLGWVYHSVSMIFFSFLALIVVHIFVVLVEEKGLESRFGNAYIEYKKSVNRWLPKIPRQGGLSK